MRIQNEENLDLQTRSAVGVASFVEFCVDHNLLQPPDKIVKNLCTFLCQDAEQTPTFSFTNKIMDGILSFQGSPAAQALSAKTYAREKFQTEDLSDAAKSRITRRGSVLAFVQLSNKFGSSLLDVVPKMWQSMAGGLISACQKGWKSTICPHTTNGIYFIDDPADVDTIISKSLGQDVIDSLSVLEAVVPTLHDELRPKLSELFPMLCLNLRSRFAIIRQAAARCFSAVCNVMTMESMLFVVEKIIPFMGDSLILTNRQGATELIYRSYSNLFFCRIESHVVPVDIVQKLDVEALPYVIFLIVPILGRMSDSDDDIRSTATNTFASLIKMVPLEVCIRCFTIVDCLYLVLGGLA
jgi:TATA-binding protein-associated factor